MNPEVSVSTPQVDAGYSASQHYSLSGAEYRALVEQSSVMLWRADVDGRCDYLSDTWLAFTGRTAAQEIGTGWAESIHPDDLEKCAERYSECCLNREKFYLEYRVRRHDGVYRWMVGRANPYFDEDGELKGFIGSTADIDDRRRAEAERERLRQAEAELVYMSRVLTMGELAASISHEIKQPIAAAQSSAEACVRSLESPVPDLGEVREAAARMSVEVRRASQIIDRVRSLYTRGEPRHDSVDVNDLVHEMVALLEHEASVHGVSIRTELEPMLPAITGDRVQLQQVLLNLMVNAIEASKGAASEMLIKTQRTTESPVLVSVRDAGVGLPTGHADRIFEAFFTTKPRGTGMGLAVSRAIVESHGGRLWATANAEAGATFQFTLPN